VMTQIHAGLSLILPSTSGGAWFLTIVMLVVLMRLIMVPLFVKQMHSMRKMSALTPQLQELRKKYKNDKQTLNEETMRLYRENGVNPLGGCLPLLAQAPMFFALFSVLRGISDWRPGSPLPYKMTESVVRSAQHANILGAKIGDKVLFTGAMHVPLHAKIVICCAVAISVVTTFMTVRQSTKRGMTPQMTPDNPMAATQKYMAYIVPLFALSGLYWAFGLVLSWVTTNVWTLGQQYMLFKRYPMPVPGAAPAGGGTAATKGTAPAGPARPSAASRPTSAKSVAPKAASAKSAGPKAASTKPSDSGQPATRPKPSAPPTRAQGGAHEAVRLGQARYRAEAVCPGHGSQGRVQAGRGPGAEKEAAGRGYSGPGKPASQHGRAASLGQRLRNRFRPAAPPGPEASRTRTSAGDARG